MNNHIIVLYSLFLVLTCIACRKDQPVQPTNNISIQKSNGVFITCEGNYLFGNAKISYYNTLTDSVQDDIYKTANNTSLGDVCQSMYFYNEKAYIVVNNSGKVVVVNANTFIQTNTIYGFTSPRYLLPINNNIAYVSDLYANKISIVDLTLDSIIGHIPCNGWTEELLLYNNKVYVTAPGGEYMYIINTTSNQLEDSINIGYGSNSIKLDKDNKLWVLCGGNQTNKNAALYCINPNNNSIEKEFQFTTNTKKPWRLTTNNTSDTLYFLNKGVYQMNIEANSLPEHPLISENTESFYGIGVEPTTGILYVADAIDYVQRGKIYRYTPNGILLNTFLVGIIPGHFYFR